MRSSAGFSDWIAGGRRGRAGMGVLAMVLMVCLGLLGGNYALAQSPVSRSAGGDANAQARGARSVAGPRDAACLADRAPAPATARTRRTRRR